MQVAGSQPARAEGLFPNLPAFRACRLENSFLGGRVRSLETFPARSTVVRKGSLCPKVPETSWWFPPGLKVTEDFAPHSH